MILSEATDRMKGDTRAFLTSPRMRGEVEAVAQRRLRARGDSPRAQCLRCDPTSPRTRGEVTTVTSNRTDTLTLLDHPQTSLSAGDSGYQRIRSDIIFGVLTPSGRLKLESMKEDYGVSVSTLREILNRLASEGFVVAEGQRGFEVAPVSIQNLRELAQLRI